jgi:hypothetical protein
MLTRIASGRSGQASTTRRNAAAWGELGVGVDRSPSDVFASLNRALLLVDLPAKGESVGSTEASKDR